jgi:DNA repair protein NreA
MSANMFSGIGKVESRRERIVSTTETICPMCRRVRRLSGEERCAIHLKAATLETHHPEFDTKSITGSSPPGVFVGRFGYPKVFVGPMVPPVSGDTTILDTPEWWMGKGFDEIVDYRYSLLRGYSQADIQDARRGSKVIDTLQEVAMMTRPVETELVLTRPPRKILDMREDSQPFGPIAPLASFQTGNSSVDERIEKAFYDRDLRADDAVLQLYRNNVLVTRIQRAFSLGMFGEGKKRKLVPTRWSITAVDSNLSLRLMARIRRHQMIDKYRVYKYNYLDNLYVGILTPESWRFEWIEAWFEPELLATSFPDVNMAEDVNMIDYTSPGGYRPVMLGDSEGYRNRTTYAKPGGCYYSARLAVSEYLDSIRRQAGAIMLREIHPGYIMPVGVWNVRESLRSLLKTRCQQFDTMDSALNYATTILEIPKRSWIETSALLQKAYFQKKISEYN